MLKRAYPIREPISWRCREMYFEVLPSAFCHEWSGNRDQEYLTFPEVLFVLQHVLVDA